MHATTLTAVFGPRAQRVTTQDKTAKPLPKGGPVLIHDVVAPVQGSTLLHVLLKRWAERDLE